jgi:hypothetical protein
MKPLKLTIFVFCSFMLATAFGKVTCPTKLKIDVTEIAPISYTNDLEIEKIFNIGDKQTSKKSISETIKQAATLQPFSEVLSFKRSTPEAVCEYKGRGIYLSVVDVNGIFEGSLHMESIKNGSLVYLVTTFSSFSNNRVSNDGRKKSDLVMELVVKDAATSAKLYSDASIGKAKLKYSIFE